MRSAALLIRDHGVAGTAGASGATASPASLGLDVRGLDDGPPALDLGLLLGGKRLRGLLGARPDFLADVAEALDQCRIGQRVHHRGVELGDDILRRALGHPQPMPERGVQARHSRLVHGGDVGRRPPALPGEDRKGLEPSAADMCQVVRGLAEREVDLSGHQVLHQRGAAAIGHELEAGAGLLLKVDRGNVGRSADAHRPHRRLAGVGLHPGDHLLQVRRRERGFRHDPLRRIGEQRHRLEVLDDIVWQGLRRGIDDVGLHVPEAERVAVRCRAGDAADADGAAGAAHVLDHHRLAEEASHRLREDAAQRVGGAAGGIRHDHRDRPRGIGLNRGLCRCGLDRSQAQSNRDHGKSHCHRVLEQALMAAYQIYRSRRTRSMPAGRAQASRRPLCAARLAMFDLPRDTMKRSRRTFLQLAAGAAALPALSRFASAQAYPTRPLRMIIGYPPGGSADITARLTGQWLSERLGQPVVIESRPGAATNLATEAVVRAPPDGYTLLLVAPANAINATLYEKLNFNFLRDIAPVAGIIRFPNVVVVNPSLPIKTIPELIAYAKANPGKLNMASSGNGSTIHMSGELFKMMTGINMVHVPYRGGAPALTDMISGQVQVMFDNIPTSAEHVKAGRLRGLAVTSAERSEVLPDLPTVADVLPGYEASAWYGLGVPKGTPPEIIDKLNTETNAILADPKAKARFAELGASLLPGTPAEFGKLMEDETEKWGKVVKFAGVKPD